MKSETYRRKSSLRRACSPSEAGKYSDSRFIVDQLEMRVREQYVRVKYRGVV
jgi:hypothetical protein